MVIGVDGNEANVQNKVGVSVYTLNLLNYFKKNSDRFTRFKIFLKEKPLPQLPSSSKYFSYEVVSGKFFWTQIFLPLRLFKKEIDVFFSPAHYGPRLCPIPLVVTIHDLSYIYYPDEFLKKDLYKLRNWTKYTVLKAKKIIAVSQSTKNDLIKIYKISPQKIKVIYNGFNQYKGIKASALKEKKLQKPYILYIGTLQPRKNLVNLIQAFYKFNQIYPQFELIIAGKKGWLYQKIFEEVENLGIENKVFFTDYVTDHQLVYLYQNAFCLVMPSFYEGFGLPILEAMNFRCPVIASFSSSLPEVGGEACLYFNPQDVNDLTEKLMKLKNDILLRKKLIKKGKERIKLFSWDKCGQETLQILEELANDKNY
jgi:glycosyltransferase involved in cell wall biosynthesis